MPVSSLRFRMEADNTSVLGALKGIGNATRTLGSDIQRNIGDKLKGVFTVAVIEEVVRRTGEWALELQKSARELGVNVEEMQTLRLMADRAGVSTDKLFNFYNKIEAAATKAAGGNTKLMQSFNRLGIQIKDLKGPERLGTVPLGQAVMAGALKPGGASAIQGLGLGKSFSEVMAVARQMGGRSLEQIREQNASQITPKEQVGKMAQTWQNIMEDITSIGNKFKGITSVLLLLVDGVLKMVNGAMGTVGAVFSKKAWKGIFQSSTMPDNLTKAQREEWEANEKAGLELTYRGRSGLRSFANAATFGLAHKMGMKTAEEAYGKKGLGILGGEAMREATGGGEAAAMLATFGAGGLAKGGQMTAGAIRSAGGVATKIGAEGVGSGLGKAAGAVGKLGEVGGGIVGQGLYGSAIRLGATKLAAKIGMSKITSLVPNSYWENGYLMSKITGQPFTPTEVQGFLKTWAADSTLGISALKQSAKAGAAGQLLMSGVAGAGDVGEGFPELTPEERKAMRPDRGGLLNLGAGGAGGGAGGSGNLGIGGVMGVDVMGRIANLNSQMVDLLQQIVINTGGIGEKGVGEDQTA